MCSPFVRYAGAVYLVLWSAMILWSSFATGVAWTGVPIIISAYWIVLLATGLSLAVLLVLSQKKIRG